MNTVETTMPTQPTTPEEMDKIVYEKIARKDLSFGCIVRSNQYSFETTLETVFDSDGRRINYINRGVGERIDNKYEVIGHPILLSDVLNYVYTDYSGEVMTARDKIVFLWNFSVPTYESQSEECKDFIRNLVK